MNLQKFIMAGVALALLPTSLTFAETKIDATRATAAGVRDFGFELFQSLTAAKKSDGDSVAISPLSLAEAITLATNGAKEKTRTELEDLFISPELRRQGADIGMLTVGVVNLRKRLAEYAKKSDGTFEFTSANALWANENPNVEFKFHEPYTKLATDNYGAKLTTEDFATLTKIKTKSGEEKEVQRAVANINTWVDKNTKGKITDLVDKLGREDVAVLLNAIYAKGQFREHFYEISEGDYTAAKDDKPIRVSYLTKKEHVGIYDDNKVTAYSFNVGSNKPNAPKDEIAVDILVPKAGDLRTLAKSLNGKYYEEIVEKFKVKEIILSMPAGRVEQQRAEKLKQFLIEKPFDLKQSFDKSAANFLAMGQVKDKRNLYIDDILTKTFYEVSPFGFEAAAATAVLMAGKTSAPKQPEARRISQPAIHVIRHIATGLPLFIVSYDKPTLYTEAQLLDFVVEGYAKTRGVVAIVKGGTIRVAYDEKKQKEVLALTDTTGKIVKEFAQDLKK